MKTSKTVKTKPERLINLKKLKSMLDTINENIVEKEHLSPAEAIYLADEAKRYYKWVANRMEQEADAKEQIKEFIESRKDHVHKSSSKMVS